MKPQVYLNNLDTSLFFWLPQKLESSSLDEDEVTKFTNWVNIEYPFRKIWLTVCVEGERTVQPRSPRVTLKSVFCHSFPGRLRDHQHYWKTWAGLPPWEVLLPSCPTSKQLVSPSSRLPTPLLLHFLRAPLAPENRVPVSLPRPNNHRDPQLGFTSPPKRPHLNLRPQSAPGLPSILQDVPSPLVSLKAVLLLPSFIIQFELTLQEALVLFQEQCCR